MLQYRAIVSAVGSRILHKGLFLLDAFRGFDTDNDGQLNCSELYSGLRFLGLDFKPELVYVVLLVWLWCWFHSRTQHKRCSTGGQKE
jgi:hypothetical protein